MILNVGAGGATDADKIKYGDSNVGATLDNLNESVDDLNESLDKVRTYVGEDGKLHFVDASGADSVLPFSNSYQLFCVITTSTDQFQAGVCCIDIKDGVITKSTAFKHTGGSHSSDMGTVSYSGAWKITFNQDFVMNGTEYKAGQTISWGYTTSVAYCFIKK